MNNSVMIGILGAGISGLALGYFLNKKGIDYTILEKDIPVLKPNILRLLTELKKG